MRYLFLLFLLVFSGCVADVGEPVDSADLVTEETDPSKPVGARSGPSDPDPCAPTLQVIEINGEEHVIEIPVECHPLDPLDIHWGDDYNGLPEAHGQPGDHHEEQFDTHRSLRQENQQEY